jgi:hypothetical protein
VNPWETSRWIDKSKARVYGVLILLSTPHVIARPVFTLFGGVYGYWMTDGMFTPESGGMAVRLVYRGALSTEY